MSRLLFLMLAIAATWPMTNASAQDAKADPMPTGPPPTPIKIEPQYTCDAPLFALAVFGADQTHAMWMVLDKADSKSELYDKLFVDLDHDGDLTDTNEQFEFSSQEDTKKIELPDLTLSDSSSFSKIAISLRDGKKGECMFKALWNEEIRFGGGYPETSKNGYMVFSKEMKTAPTVFFKGNAPFEFQPWYPSDLVIGAGTDFKVFMGHRGKGFSSFCSTLGHILPKDEVVLATLKYVDKDGNQKRADVKFKERCWSMLYHGLVQVPKDAVAGEASLIVQLSDDSKFKSKPTELKVKLVSGEEDN